MTTRWIIHDLSWGYLLRPEYPTAWGTDKDQAYRFRHKRDALRIIASFAPETRKRFLIEALRREVVFD